MTASSFTPPIPTSTRTAVFNVLRAHGLRISTARRAVVQALFAAKSPVSAEEIADGLGGRRVQLDLASVYRNLETLEGIGIVRHLHVGHGPGRYVLSAGTERQYLACERCDEVVEIEPNRIDELRAQIRDSYGYEVRFTHFPIVGVCPGCVQGSV